MSLQRANINFYLKSGKSSKSGERSILMRITFNSQRVVLFLNEVIHPKYWSTKKQRVKPPKEDEPDNNYEYINTIIVLYKAKAENAIAEGIKNDLVFSHAYFKNYFNKFETSVEKFGFFEAFEKFIAVSKADKQNRTIKGYITVKKYLEGFQQKTDYNIDINSIDQVFFDKLKEYSFVLREKPVQQNYFAKIITVLKTLLNWCSNRGYYHGVEYRNFKANEVNKEIIYLEPDEFKHLLEYKFESKKYDKVRDIFCFSCLTGFRYSDLVRLKKEHYKDGHICIIEQKNNKSLKVPVVPQAQEIINRYDDLPSNLIPVISIQKLNEYIKKACEEAKINSPVVLYRYFGNRKVETIVPKHDVITIHAARKTFITISFIFGMDPKTVKSITGHTKDSSFDKYLKISDKFRQEKMLEAWGKL
jgi:integrase